MNQWQNSSSQDQWEKWVTNNTQALRVIHLQKVDKGPLKFAIIMNGIVYNPSTIPFSFI